ncbi:hypothetical protein C8R47DRAFT_1215409 [Mycena vitilis]|nr:hypothetical protein C8R47DRAFT_1215409 [Mycena vitilis]
MVHFVEGMGHGNCLEVKDANSKSHWRTLLHDRAQVVSLLALVNVERKWSLNISMSTRAATSTPAAKRSNYECLQLIPAIHHPGVPSMIIHGDELPEARGVHVGSPCGFLRRVSRFLLSMLAIILAKLTAHFSTRPVIKNRHAAVTSITLSPPTSLRQEDSLPDESSPPLAPSTRRESLEKPFMDVEGEVEDTLPVDSAPPLQASLSPADVELRASPPLVEVGFAASPPRPQTIHLPTPTDSEIPTISISPPPTPPTPLEARESNPYHHLCKDRYHLRKSPRPRPYPDRTSSTSRLRLWRDSYHPVFPSTDASSSPIKKLTGVDGRYFYPTHPSRLFTDASLSPIWKLTRVGGYPCHTHTSRPSPDVSVPPISKLTNVDSILDRFRR